MKGVFISYRQDDAKPWALLLRQDLVEAFGDEWVFLDKDTLRAGNWRAQIQQALDRSGVALVVIGRRWLASADDLGKRRLDSSDDVHRQEIASALSRKDVTVIPVVVDGASIPRSEELPADIRSLTDQQTRPISDNDAHRKLDLALLIGDIERATGLVARRPARRFLSGQRIFAGSLILVTAIVVSLAPGFYRSLWRGEGSVSQTASGAESNPRIPEVDRQMEIDARALGIVERQLNPRPGAPPLSQQEINAAILTSSPSIKVQIFDRASGLRSQNWMDRETKPIMERTIPVFRALVASDSEDANHGYHGQLGYSLKDRRQPDWSEAETELSKAIELRGPSQAGSWLFYEFNRAVCRINLDQDFAHNRPSDIENTRRIMADLTAAATAPDVRDIIAGEPDINRWLILNKVKWPK